MAKQEITIAIPSYRNVQTLKRAIDSVYNLKKGIGIDWKLLISEDYSENHADIEALVKSYADNRIRYICHNPRLGMASNWNYCIQNSNTEIVALLHDDDYLLPQYLIYVEKILNSNLKWDCISFAHEFEIDGVRQHEEEGKIKKNYRLFFNMKVRKVRALDYLLGGYNYISIPTCGILYKKTSLIKYGGYNVEDGFSADEQFFERLCRRGGNVYFYNAKTSVYTYTTNRNLSSNHDIQKKFVFENIEHRKEIVKESKILKRFIMFWDESMTLYQVGKWKNILVPELKVDTKLKLKTYVFAILCKAYQYSKIFSYKQLV